LPAHDTSADWPRGWVECRRGWFCHCSRSSRGRIRAILHRARRVGRWNYREICSSSAAKWPNYATKNRVRLNRTACRQRKPLRGRHLRAGMRIIVRCKIMHSPPVRRRVPAPAAPRTKITEHETRCTQARP
jgi:hypothetical protein